MCLKRPLGLFFLLYFLHGWASYPLMAPLWTDLRLCFHTPHHSSWSLKSVTHKLNPLPGMFLCNLHSLAMMVQNWVAAALLSWCVYSPLDHGPQVISFIPVWLSCPWKGMCVCDFWLEEYFQTVFPGLLRVPRGYFGIDLEVTKQETQAAFLPIFNKTTPLYASVFSPVKWETTLVLLWGLKETDTYRTHNTVSSQHTGSTTKEKLFSILFIDFLYWTSAKLH